MLHQVYFNALLQPKILLTRVQLVQLNFEWGAWRTTFLVNMKFERKPPSSELRANDEPKNLWQRYKGVHYFHTSDHIKSLKYLLEYLTWIPHSPIVFTINLLATLFSKNSKIMRPMSVEKRRSLQEILSTLSNCVTVHPSTPHSYNHLMDTVQKEP